MNRPNAPAQTFQLMGTYPSLEVTNWGHKLVASFASHRCISLIGLAWCCIVCVHALASSPIGAAAGQGVIHEKHAAREPRCQHTSCPCSNCACQEAQAACKSATTESAY
eukprot:1156369-Pelagomonas_calceolata.AAC.3